IGLSAQRRVLTQAVTTRLACAVPSACARGFSAPERDRGHDPGVAAALAPAGARAAPLAGRAEVARTDARGPEWTARAGRHWTSRHATAKCGCAARPAGCWESSAGCVP